MRSLPIVGATLVLSSVVLVIAGVASWQSNRRLAAASAAVLHTKDIQLGLQRALADMVDAETGQRGFLLTQRAEYLQPYEQALARAQGRLAELRTLVSTQPDLRRSLDELTALTKVKTDELSRTIELTRSGAADDARSIVQSGTGRFAMDEIRTIVRRMQDDEDRALTANLDDQRQALGATVRSVIVTTLLAIGILVVLVYVTRRESTRVRASQQRLATTLRSIGDAVIATDEAGRIDLMNPVAEALTGWSAEEADRRPLDDVIRVIHEDTRANLESPAVMALREQRIVDLGHRALLVRRDGTETPIEDSAAPIVATDGGVHGAVLVLRDATKLRDAEHALEDADRRKNEFLAVLAHELRNPLAPIRQAAQIARSPAATPAQVGWSHEVIERQVEQMARLLDDLLDVSRITRGTLEVRKTRVELSSIVDAAIEMARPLIDGRRHTLEVDLATEPLTLEADPLRLAQVIANLLTNAAKYTKVGGRIQLSTERAGDEAIVHIVDDGIGLPRDALSSIFQVFVQVSSPLERSEGGLGIGLALSKGLVELHGGTIEARSQGLGRGSEFLVRLPLTAEYAAADLPTPSPGGPHRPTGLRVLVADDNRDAAASLAALLELRGHRVDVVHDGEAAMDALERSKPDIALLDIGMPRINGYELAERVRARAWGAAITLVAVTGWGQVTDRNRAFAAGFDHHWVKPIEPAAAIAFCDAAATARSGGEGGIRTLEGPFKPLLP